MVSGCITTSCGVLSRGKSIYAQGMPYRVAAELPDGTYNGQQIGGDFFKTALLVCGVGEFKRLVSIEYIVIRAHEREREHIKTRCSRVYNKKMTAILLGEDT